MAKSVLIPLQVAAKNIDSLNANFVSAAAVQNGELFAVNAKSSDADKTEVYTITTPATATLSGLYMAWNPEDVLATAGDNKYKIGDLDPRNFETPAGTVFSGYKPQVEDRLLISADGIGGTIGINTFAVAADGEKFLQWSASAGAGLSYKLLGTSYISIAGGFPSQRVTAYELRCVKN
jgi:hypothetical protein